MARRFGVRRGFDTPAYKRMLRSDPCAYCRAPFRHDRSYREVDHIHARARGGPNRWDNYTSACGFCNVCKFDTPLLAWLIELEGLADEIGVTLGISEIPCSLNDC